MKKMYETAASVAAGMRPASSYSASSSLPPDFLASAGDPGAPWDAVSSVQFSSVAQSSTTFCDPMDSSTTGFPVNHQLPELAETHVHRVNGAIQPSHPLSSLSPPAFNLKLQYK